MQIKSNYSEAERHSRQIISNGNSITRERITDVFGGNSYAISRCNTLRSTIAGILSRYATVCERDSNQISFLAENFLEIDRDLARSTER